MPGQWMWRGHCSYSWNFFHCMSMTSTIQFHCCSFAELWVWRTGVPRIRFQPGTTPPPRRQWRDSTAAVTTDPRRCLAARSLPRPLLRSLSCRCVESKNVQFLLLLFADFFVDNLLCTILLLFLNLPWCNFMVTHSGARKTPVYRSCRSEKDEAENLAANCCFSFRGKFYFMK